MSISPNPKSLRLMTVSMSALAIMTGAQSAFAQQNDVDAYDGVVPGACASTAIGATATNGRNNNTVSGRGHCIGDNSDINMLSGGNHTIGANAFGNLVSGASNRLGDGSGYNNVGGFLNRLGDNYRYSIVGGQFNIAGNGGTSNFLTGDSNAIGDSSSYVFVGGGAENILGDFISGITVFGSSNTVSSGVAGAGGFLNSVQILGANNSVNGAASHYNVITGNSAVVEGTGNFVGGGNDMVGPSVTGNDNIVLGAGASSVVDNAVAIGSGSAATLDIAAAQAAWAGGVVGSTTFTEGTDASGGEMNIGDRLLTGVADGRVAAGSSDAVNGHQLFEAVSAAGGGVGACGDGTGTDSLLCGDGASAAGDQATALGDNAGADFGGSVALGFGSITTMDIAAAQAAYSGVTIGGLTLTEGTDAAGGEVNIGNRLVTGVADGRVASGSSDAVNGHQLFEVASDLDGRVTANANSITTIQGDVSTLQGDVSTLQGDVSNLEGDVTALQADVIGNTGDISVLQNDVMTNTSDIAGLQGDVTVLQGDVAANTTAIGNNTAAIGANSTAIATNRGDIDANSTAIAGINTDFTDLTARVDANEDTNDWQDMDIATNKEAIATEASRNDAQAVAINENEGRISENATAILGNSQLISENQALIGRNYGLILDNAARIDKLASGVAMSMSVPDAYLDRSEDLAIAGGLGTFDGEVGVGAAMTIRGNDQWSFSAAVAGSGGEYGGKVSARWSR